MTTPTTIVPAAAPTRRGDARNASSCATTAGSRNGGVDLRGGVAGRERAAETHVVIDEQGRDRQERAGGGDRERGRQLARPDLDEQPHEHRDAGERRLVVDERRAAREEADDGHPP